MKKLNIFFIIVFSLFTIGCQSPNKKDTIFNDCPQTFHLRGKVVEMPDTIIRVLGKAYVYGDNYLYYMYHSPYLFSISDKNFRNFRDFGLKGEGAGELQGAFVIDNPLNPDCPQIYDYRKNKIFTTSSNSDLSLIETLSFPQIFNEYAPPRVIQLKNGSFVGIRGDFRYGLICYNPESGTVEEWPLGEDFDNDNPDYGELSLRVLGYNKDKGIIAEIYGSLPTVILHKEDGSIIKRIRYSGYSKHKDPKDQVADCFGEMVLTNEYIWLLYGDQDESSESKVFCIDYEGNPIAELIIDSTTTIAVDEIEKKIIATDTSDNERNLVVYELPEALFNRTK